MESAASKIGIPTRLVQAWHRLEVLTEPPRSGRLHDFVHSTRFQQLATAVIIFNGWEASYAEEYALRVGREHSESTFIEVAELCLYAFYLTEVAIKLWVHGLYFFCGDDWKFNSFDFLLILQFTYERMALYLLTSETDSASFMRLFRFLRIARALRVVRAIRIFDDLCLLMESLAHSLASFVWMLLALFLTIYVFALIVQQGATTYILHGTENYDEERAQLMRERFGSISLCMISLYKAGTGGQSWEIFYDLIAFAGPVYAVAFIFFISFFSIGVYNIMTGMMVDNVMRVSLGDKERHAERWRQEKLERGIAFADIIKRMDTDGSGTISWEEFEAELMDPDSQLPAHFASLDLDIKSTEHFFDALTTLTGKRNVPINAFAEGCMRTAGAASSIDLHLLSVQLDVAQARQTRMIESLSRQLQRSHNPKAVHSN